MNVMFFMVGVAIGLMAIAISLTAAGPASAPQNKVWCEGGDAIAFSSEMSYAEALDVCSKAN